jgi:hypothetical protein
MGRWPKILIAFVMAAVIGFALYHNIQKWHQNRVTKAITQEQRIWQEKNEILEEKVERLQDELAEARGTPQNDDRIAEALGLEEPAGNQTEPITSQPPEDLEARIAAFFAYLDQQPYVKEYQLAGGTYAQYREAVEKLAQNPPAIAGETDMLYRLLKNIAHFYRILGKQNVRLAKDVLTNEEEILESVMRTYYRWFISGDATDMTRPTDETLYTYSAYFLNTIGGRSYLLRRDSRVRALTQYYCVLLIDRANDLKLNAYGIDVRPHIRNLLEDLRNLLGLADRNEYVRTLENLQQKYEMVAATR